MTPHGVWQGVDALSASVRILSEVLGQVAARNVTDRALQALVVEGVQVEIGIDICWARKSSGDRSETRLPIAS